MATVLPLQPSNTTAYFAFIYFTIFFVCISKSYWISFAIPYCIINGIGDIIIRLNKQKLYGPNRDYWTFVLVASLQYISMWQSFHNTSYNKIDYVIAFFLVYSHFSVMLNFLYFDPYLFAQYKLYRFFIGWIAELHYSSSLFSLYIFPIYPIISCCIYYGIIGTNPYKYLLIMLYFIFYCYVLHSLLLSLNPQNPNKWTYFKMDCVNNKNKTYTKSESLRFKFNEYYIGNDIKDNNNKHILRICQISDCHLDSLFTANELHKLCINIVDFDPDLVLLTGDFYYTKHDDIPRGLLKYALSPLTKIANKCYGCLGNHDIKKDFEESVVSEFKTLNIKLLRNESVLHNEFIEIVGFDFIKNNTNNKRSNMMKNVLKSSKLKCDSDKQLKIVLLHNPNNFDDFDGNENIMVFSGHQHGGHVGFYVLGFYDFSLFQWLYGLKDYGNGGVMAKGNNRMYIHRGNTLYSKEVLRFGVPAEQQSCILINHLSH